MVLVAIHGSCMACVSKLNVRDGNGSVCGATNQLQNRTPTCWSRIYPSPWPRWHPEMGDPRGPAALVEVPWHSASQTAFWGSLTRTRDYLLSNPGLLDASPPSPPALPVD